MLEGCPADVLKCTTNHRSASFYEGYACNETVACEMGPYTQWEQPGGWTASPLDLNVTRCSCGAGTYGVGCGLVCPEVEKKSALMEKLCPSTTAPRAKCNKTAGEIWDGTFDNIGSKSKYVECYLLHDEYQSGLGKQIVGGLKKHRINVTIYQNVTPGKLSAKVPHTIHYSITSRFRPSWDDVGGLTDPRFKTCSTRYNDEPVAGRRGRPRECCGVAVTWLNCTLTNCFAKCATPKSKQKPDTTDVSYQCSEVKCTSDVPKYLAPPEAQTLDPLLQTVRNGQQEVHKKK